MLADTVRTLDTIRESGRNLLAYRVRGGHYPWPDAIRYDTGSLGPWVLGSTEYSVPYAKGWKPIKLISKHSIRFIGIPGIEFYSFKLDSWLVGCPINHKGHSLIGLY